MSFFSHRNTYNVIVRTIFALIFGAGGIAHFILGRINGEGYEVFASTAWAPLATLWQSWVMPHIAVLTIVVGVVEVLIAVGLMLGRRYNLWATMVASCFFCFILLLGYGMPQTHWVGDILVNRLFTIVMLVALLPNLFTPFQYSLLREWRMLLKR